MKKVFSLVLALAMVLGMSTMAFAATAKLGTGIGVLLDNTAATFEAQVGKSATITYYVTSGAAGTLTAAEYTALQGGSLDLDWDPTSSDASLLAVLSSASMNVSKVEGNLVKVVVTLNIKSGAFVGIHGAGDALVFVDKSGEEVTIDFTAGIEVISASSGSAAGAIPSNIKINAIDPDWTSYLTTWTQDGIDLSLYPVVHEDLDTRHKLVAGMFEWVDDKGNKVAVESDWELTEVRSSLLKDVGVRKTNPVNNSGTLRDAFIDGTKLRIRTVQYFLKCGKTDVAFDLDLTFKSKASGDRYAANFTIQNDQVWMYDGQDYVETTDPVYVQADVSLRNVEMFLGENLYITKSFGKDQKAYAHVSLELSAGDEKLFMQYPELSDVYTLYTVGVNSANVYAEFKDLGDTYFVYNEAYKLIGTTADKKLPFSNKYYLTTKKVDLAGTAATEEEPASSTTPGDTGAVDTGGAATAPSTNYNPNTGR